MDDMNNICLQLFSFFESCLADVKTACMFLCIVLLFLPIACYILLLIMFSYCNIVCVHLSHSIKIYLLMLGVCSKEVQQLVTIITGILCYCIKAFYTNFYMPKAYTVFVQNHFFGE